MTLTQAQNDAIAARGNVLVVAGAGTGKTSTLVERCLSCLLEEKRPASLDQVLMVTFTEAAAADMRRRIRERLEHELDQALAREPAGARGSRYWQEQLALFENAHIGTLHSFCFKLIREHFYDLALDPQLAVLPEEEAGLLAEDTLEEILSKYYGGDTPQAAEVRQVIQRLGGGVDRPVRALVRRLHEYAQTLPNPAGWLDGQLAAFQSPEPLQWRQWLRQALADWHQLWLEILNTNFEGNQIAAACASALRNGAAAPLWTFEQYAAGLDKILSACETCPRGKKQIWVEPLKGFFKEAEFLSSLLTADGAEKLDPLAQDWEWVRGQMRTLLELTREFTKAYTECKRELGVVDYHDLEQYALSLLWDHSANAPTEVACQWRRKLRFLFVDEYQDINAAQDKIIEALSGEGAEANRFLVGDIKQSIYRFRLADPRIFHGYLLKWNSANVKGIAQDSSIPLGRTIPLVDNFRSREGLLQFINSVFALLMRADLGGVAYDEQARLRFGAPERRRALSLESDPGPHVELHLHRQGGDLPPEAEEAPPDAPADPSAEELAEIAELETAAKEARMLALRLGELKARRHLVWDEKAAEMRPVQWNDMAVLLRAPSRKAESYAREFSRLGIPLVVARGGFYDCLEVSDLLSLLRILDNPLQDLPLLAVLRSPLVGLAVNDLARIRLAAPGTFWNALTKWNPTGAAGPGAQKVALFLERYSHWRRLARQMSLTRCLDTVLAETHYADWVLSQPRGEQRRANLKRLSALARQFDQFQRQGLFRFLQFIDAQQRAENEPSVPPVSAGDAVRLMSIHQSKGLEFPVVAVADLAKPFNLQDLAKEIILDEEFGLCPLVTPPGHGQSYPSLPYWLARRRQTRELLAEEQRLLYVAMTRARDLLLLTASLRPKQLDKAWTPAKNDRAVSLLAARSYADWLAAWFAQNVAQGSGGPAALSGLWPATPPSHLRWFIHDDSRLAEPAAPQTSTTTLVPPQTSEPAYASAASPPIPTEWENLRRRLFCSYPFAEATLQPAKTSVSSLRVQAADLAADDEAAAWPIANRHPPIANRHSQLKAVEIGTAHHVFLQYVSLDRVGSVKDLKAEAQRLERMGALTPEQFKALEYPKLAAFWDSELGQRVRTHAQHVRRELSFTARFSPRELGELVGEPTTERLDDEFIVVQGVADLAVLLPDEIWLVDFKTDAIKSAEAPARARLYAPQLKLYALALSRIHRRRAGESWLYFLACAQPVKINAASPSLLPS